MKNIFNLKNLEKLRRNVMDSIQIWLKKFCESGQGQNKGLIIPCQFLVFVKHQIEIHRILFSRILLS